MRINSSMEDYRWLPFRLAFPVVSGGFRWFPVVSDGFRWFLVVSAGFPWLALVIVGYPWLPHGHFIWPRLQKISANDEMIACAQVSFQ